jgi:hypothetical protein
LERYIGLNVKRILFLEDNEEDYDIWVYDNDMDYFQRIQKF